MKDECQPSGADRRYRTVPTLPANLTLSPAERAEIERHALALKDLCEQTPLANADCEAVVTAALLFVVLGWQWLLLPGLVLEAIPGVGVLPFWLLVVGAIAVLGTPRPKIGQR